MNPPDWPFRRSEVLQSGALTVRELRRFYRAPYPGVYLPRGMDLSPTQRARAAWLWSGRRGVVAGLSAAALLGAKWIEPNLPAELNHDNRRPPAMLVVHTDELAPDEVCDIDEIATTTPGRTAFDIGRRSSLTEGVQRIDALMQATDVKVVDIEAVIDRHPGVRGLVRLRQTLRLVDGGAESPYESLTRLHLMQAGFPPPQTQIPVLDAFGRVFARLDMGWRQYRVGVEFDGAQHWTDAGRRTWDIDRQALLDAAGWAIVRVSAKMLNRPHIVLDRVAGKLKAAGCKW
ncbi:MAG: DUF559 domain-containing protein [Mycobacteriaceae bacterium]|nr:DUF559 domain-containing protein [Mycobacteriaceae bacterium]MBV9640018.1 DUF559 domain-containing protein [Mycobacteriaceae bacterium]